MRGELLTAVGKTGLSAAVMVLAVVLLRLRFQERTPRRVFCLLWDLVLLRLLAPVELPSPVSIRRWLPALSMGRTAETDMASTLMPGAAVYADTGTIRQAHIHSVVEDTVVSQIPSPSLDWGMVLTVLWMAGVAILAVWLLWNHLRSRRIYAASLPVRDEFVLDWLAEHPLRRPVQVRSSDRIAAPLTYGVLYPVILLPRGVRDGETLSCVLPHEHEHIRRFDAVRKGLLAAALCLHWFNPLVWAMYVLANRDMELACDEAVLRSGADREGYALALLGLEERRGGWSPTGSHFSRNALEERIKAIMKRKHISFTALVAVLIVMAITTTVFASAAPEDKEDSHKNPPETSYVYDHLGIVEDDGMSIMSKGGEDGEKLYSVDGGKTWMSEERYQAEYGSGWGDDWQVEWWTYEDYKAWLEEEKIALQSIIGERAYTSTDGWFIWDQKKVDETIALYESILEDIKNGALHSKTIIDKNGNTVEDVALGSDGPLNAVVTSTFDETDMVIAEKSVDEAALLEELKALGIGGNANLMTYNGELVRTLVDGAPVGDNEYSIQYVYTNPDGMVDLHTLRAVIYNPDGSYDVMGNLTGLAAKGDKNFDQALIDAATFSGPQVAYAEGNGGEGGKTFEKIFAQYADYGLTYVPTGSGRGNLTYNGQPVEHFADLKPDGSTFTFGSDDGGELKLFTQYDANGKLIGLTTEIVPVKAVSVEKRELGFDYSAPVQGKLSTAFGANRYSFHYGVDFTAAKGTDVTAFASGTVSEVGFDADLGNYVVLSHEGGYSTLYGHCGSIAVSAGDSISMGEKIAETGASGRATGPMLHFELRDGGVYLDPAQYLDTLI